MGLEQILALINGLIMQIIPESEPLEPSDIVDFASGIFAVFLMVVSLYAYRNRKSKRLLLVTAAFGLFALRAIISSLDLLIPEVESTIIELALALTGFAILSLFFFAIVKRSN
jgi:hypothetical protein